MAPAASGGGLTLDIREKLVTLFYENNVRCDQKIEGLADDVIDIIAHSITTHEWISVKDRLPDNKEYDWVLAQVVEDNGFMHIPTVMEYRQSKNDWFEETYGWISEHNGAFTVTHWMPLPEPPKGE